MRREDDGGFLLVVQPPDKIAHGNFGNGIESNRWFIKKKNVGVVQERCGNLTAHTLSQAELADRCAEDLAEVQKRCQFVQIAPVYRRFHLIDVTDQLEGVDYRDVPPELRALAEHHADVAYVLAAVLPRHQPIDPTVSAVRIQDAAHDLDRAAFPGAVGAYVANHLPLADMEGDVLKRRHQAVFAPEKRANGFAHACVPLCHAEGLANVFQFNHLCLLFPYIIVFPAVVRTRRKFNLSRCSKQFMKLY